MGHCVVTQCSLVYFGISDISVISDIMGSLPTFLLLVLLTWTAQESLCKPALTGGDSLEKATFLPTVYDGENTTGGDLSFVSGEESNRMMFKRDLNRARRRGKRVCRCIKRGERERKRFAAAMRMGHLENPASMSALEGNASPVSDSFDPYPIPLN